MQTHGTSRLFAFIVLIGVTNIAVGGLFDDLKNAAANAAAKSVEAAKDVVKDVNQIMPAQSSEATRKDIRTVQQRLNLLGYSVGTPDGIMGGRTENAIRSYQNSVGTAATGQVSQQLLAQLQQSVSQMSAVSPAAPSISASKKPHQSSPVAKQSSNKKQSGGFLASTKVGAASQGVADTVEKQIGGGDKIFKGFSILHYKGIPVAGSFPLKTSPEFGALLSISLDKGTLHKRLIEGTPQEFPLIARNMHRSEQEKYFECLPSNVKHKIPCSFWKGGGRLGQTDEFKVRASMKAFKVTVVPHLKAYARKAPKKVYLYHQLYLHKYDFDGGYFPTGAMGGYNPVQVNIGGYSSNAYPTSVKTNVNLPEKLFLKPEQAEALQQKLENRTLHLLLDVTVTGLTAGNMIAKSNGQVLYFTDSRFLNLYKTEKNLIKTASAEKGKEQPTPKKKTQSTKTVVAYEKTIYPSQEYMIGLLKRDVGLTAKMMQEPVVMIFKLNDEFERREKLSEFDSELKKIKIPENETINAPVTVHVGEYDFERKGFPVESIKGPKAWLSPHQFVRVYPMASWDVFGKKIDFSYKLNFNVASLKLDFITVPVETAKKIVKSGRVIKGTVSGNAKFTADKKAFDADTGKLRSLFDRRGRAYATLEVDVRELTLWNLGVNPHAGTEQDVFKTFN